jgi:hypothetical protein
MKLSAISTFAALITVVSADWSVWEGFCDTGFGTFTNNNVRTSSQGSCGGGAVWDNTIGPFIEFTSQNPCNNGETFIYKPNGAEWHNVYVQGKENVQIGTCRTSARTTAACQTAGYWCSMLQYSNCQSSYCN